MEVGYRSLALLFALIILGALFAVPAARAQAPLEPCCSITAINTSTGEVSAKVNSSGATFAFRLADLQGLSALSVGQGVYANFATRQISLNGKSMAGTMINMAAANMAAMPARAALLTGAKPALVTGDPCCTIAAINSATHVVTTHQSTDGQAFQFKVSQQVMQTLKVGQAVGFPTPSTGSSGPQPHMETQPGNYTCFNSESNGGLSFEWCDPDIGTGGVTGGGGVNQGPGPSGSNPGAGGSTCGQCEIATAKQYAQCTKTADQMYAKGSSQLTQALSACSKIRSVQIKSCPCS
jgi:hypothetical protein